MRCPYCATDDDRVVDSRSAEGGAAVRRRRECAGCGQRFSTYERAERPALVVRKRDGRHQPFDPDKLAAGIARAATDLGVDEADLRRTAAQVEARLHGLGRDQIDTDTIGSAVLGALRALHPVAAVRFASVYKHFTTTEEFRRELEQVDPDNPTAG